MNREKILIIDDEVMMCDLIASFLSREEYEIFVANDAETALRLVEEADPDLILLDIMLPDISGLDLCLRLRQKTQCHILFLSCKSEEIDKIIAFSAGGDDYITKPFQAGELVARVRAHLRRQRIASGARQEPAPVYECMGLTVDPDQHQVFLDGREISLTPKEFQILVLLIREPRRVFSMEQIFERVWKTDSLEGDSRTIMVYISNIRKKIEPENRNIRYIINVRGAGYKFSSGAVSGGGPKDFSKS